MSAQFPPSSPLIGADSEVDPFRKPDAALQERGRNAGYPTPNPSSTTGRSSSPARFDSAHPFFPLDLSKKKSVVFSDTKTVHKYGDAVAINRDFNILNPDEAVMRIPITPTTTDAVLIGRSSKNCAYHINTKDKSISRVHFLVVAVPLTANPCGSHFILKCLGYNGCTVQIPRFCYVTQMSRNHYSIVEGTKPGDLSKVITNRSIKLDYNHTEFHMNRGESFSVPFQFDNILLDIRGNLILLNPVDIDEELTDEEAPELQHKATVSPTPALSQPKGPLFKIHEDLENAPVSTSTETPSTPQKLTASTTSYSSPNEDRAKSALPEPTTPKQHSSKHVVIQTKEPLTPKAKILNYEQSPVKLSSLTLPVTVSVRPAVLKDTTNTHASNPNSPYKQQKALPLFRRAHSEEPQHKRPFTQSHKEMPLESTTAENVDEKTESLDVENDGSLQPHKKKRKPNQLDEAMLLDRTVLDDVKNLIEIDNILINHLAFSRLSSTPASFLRTISKLTQNLSLRQIRVVLNGIECIGVIYRTGKDAAGKPLEEEYYYDLDKDHDLDRTQLVMSIKGNGGLRSCRKTHKQYYWKKPAPIKK